MTFDEKRYPLLASIEVRSFDEPDMNPDEILKSDNPKAWVEALQWIINTEIHNQERARQATGLLEEIANRL